MTMLKRRDESESTNDELHRSLRFVAIGLTRSHKHA